MKFALPFILMCSGIGFMIGSFMISPNSPTPEAQTVLVENTK